jgi:hypothetical protein
MPRPALQGGDFYRLGWFNEHYERMLRELFWQVNEFCAVPPAMVHFYPDLVCGHERLMA